VRSPEPAVRAVRTPPDPRTARRLLALLPDWFGLDDANAHYVEAAGRMATYVVADADGEAVGITLVERHFPAAAEVFLMAVHPQWHRRGVGRAMLATAEADLVAEGVRFLQVKTLGESRPDTNCEGIRKFYVASGFTPLEELTDLWPGNPCLLLVKSLPAESSGRT